VAISPHRVTNAFAGELRATDALENLLARLEAMTEREDEDLQLGLDHR